MAPYLVRRALHTLMVLLGVSVVVFFITRLGGDPAALYLPEDATTAQVQEFRERMGWDRPLVVQFGDFLLRLTRGDFGVSLRHGVPAMTLLWERVPATLELTVMAMAIALLVSVPVGVLAGLRRNSTLDSGARVAALLGLCIPNFWLGILLILIFSVQLGVLPAFGRGGFANLVLPAFTLGFSAAATIMRLLRSNVLDVLGMDYVRTARSKGLRESRVAMKHVVRNAAIPALTVVALQLGYFLSGSIVVETVFAYPGVGRLAIQAIVNRDFAVIQAFVFMSAVFFATVNLAVDVLYTLLDPRIRY